MNKDFDDYVREVEREYSYLRRSYEPSTALGLLQAASRYYGADRESQNKKRG